MTTVVSRTFRSSPHRDALQTWDAIVELLTQGKDGTARSELRAVAGVAASDRRPGTRSAPIVATCDGPRTRIYCLFDEDAIDGDDANEEVLGFEPLKETGESRCRVRRSSSAGCKPRSKAQFSHHCTGLEPRNCHAGAGRCWTSAVARPRRFPRHEHRRHLLVHALGYLCDRQHPQELERHHPAQWAGPRALADRWRAIPEPSRRGSGPVICAR